MNTLGGPCFVDLGYKLNAICQRGEPGYDHRNHIFHGDFLARLRCDLRVADGDRDRVREREGGRSVDWDRQKSFNSSRQMSNTNILTKSTVQSWASRLRSKFRVAQMLASFLYGCRVESSVIKACKRSLFCRKKSRNSCVLTDCTSR